MNDILGWMIAGAFVCFILGAVFGLSAAEEAMISDCTALGKTIIDNHVLVCAPEADK